MNKMWTMLLFCLGLQVAVSDIPFTIPLDLNVVHPVRVDERGSFLSYDLLPRFLKKRGLSPQTSSSTYYEITYQGAELIFNLSQNLDLLAPGFVSEWHSGGIREARIHRQPISSCHMKGDVQTQHHYMGNAAISICSGLKGVFQLADEDFLIEPLAVTMPLSDDAMPHRIYRRDTRVSSSQEWMENVSCGVQDQNSQEKWDRRRARWEEQQKREHKERRIRTRSISKEKWVETLVVADHKMVEYHGTDNVENYVLTVMNMVAGLFHDASIGNRINIVIVRLILLESEEEDLKISHHADKTLRNFCKWQKNLNMKGEDHPQHHDVAVLLTRKDICAAMNRPCETLGLSHVSGMCQPHRSCNINEDTGLPTAFTVTHELGHSFGVQHDGSGNDCEPKGKRPHIMSPQLLYDTSPLTWSRCSRDYITRFLDRGWGLCLDDSPSKERLDFPSVPPGVLYDVSHQCRLQYGSSSSFCRDIDNVCNTLWCSVGSTCHSKLDAAVDGTNCGLNKWCFNGNCVPIGQHPSPTDGSWGSWNSWSSCTRSCGAGIQCAERHCTNPIPRYGGRYCLGERKRFRVCNVMSCPSNTPSFRHVQCSHFNSVPYKGKLHQWTPVTNNMYPCELYCQSEEMMIAEKLLDAVIDGTPCFEGNTSRDMCINGICKNVGCDHEIDSNAVEDRCGVCHGDDSTCHTVQKTFEDSDGLGYVDIGLIPPGAREIRIEEVAEAGNFLALRSEDPEKYFLNGMWTIQWNGDYDVAGTTFTYTRTGNLENLTAPGPTYEPVWIQLLFQEKNPGVRYQYTIRLDQDNSNEIPLPEFAWRYGTWTECSATCGSGVQRQLVHCVEKMAGLVEERYCDFLTRPDDRQRSCNEEPCPPRWWVGEWQQCSTTCGWGGLQKRTVLCIQRVGLEEQRALQPADCQHLPRPEANIPCNHYIPCPAIWHHGNWSECSVSCGEGVQYREVYCNNSTEGTTCDPSARPMHRRACILASCPVNPYYNPSDWTGSGASNRDIFNGIFPVRPRAPSNPHHDREENFISEGDYSSAGEGGYGKRGNSFVDDFYYDYNFINFHEDLSYDPAEDKNINGDQLGDIPVKDLPTKPSFVEDFVTLNESHYKESTQSSIKQNASLHYVSTDSSVVLSEDQFPNSLENPNQDVVNYITEHPTLDVYVSQTESPSTYTASYPFEEFTVSSPSFPIFELPLYNKSESTPDQSHDDSKLSVFDFSSNLKQENSSHSLVKVKEETESETTSNPLKELTVSPLPELSQDHTTDEKSPEITLLDDISAENIVLDTSQDSLPSFSPSTKLHFSSSSESETRFSSERNIVSTEPIVAPKDSWSPMSTTFKLPVGTEQVHVSSVTPFTSLYITRVTDKLVASTVTSNADNYGDRISHHLKILEERTTVSTSTSSIENESSRNGHWDVGSWSECSTSCGLGAMWRSVDCRAGENGTCNPDSMPAPAHRCYLRPCASWTVGNWSKCSQNCGNGIKMRDVHCVDNRDKRLLRPFHCQSTHYKPRGQFPCYEQPCMEWYVSSWRECSEECGGGIQERLVTCPQNGLCNENLKPNGTRSCNKHHCTKWAVGPWGQCTASCEGGIQRRQVKCLNLHTGETEEDNNLCDHEPWPENVQKCNPQDCQQSQNNVSCSRDRLSFSFCRKLKRLSHCSLLTVQAQCCHTCQSYILGTQELRNQQLSLR
ncbi:hypothetical protein GDO86_006527 [Hymenochirus boettgeri]|uniref:A disintegrin and metalloproteinase with thrombospondin motifs 7 n=1 Tax=Hymenochirus boettgeri TaxID=247094 RepID=A0A8T2JBG3_9PIPI|nr:hypothetical protein GDO86_006527 [Hymenochirus boettgeri]